MVSKELRASNLRAFAGGVGLLGLVTAFIISNEYLGNRRQKAIGNFLVDTNEVGVVEYPGLFENHYHFLHGTNLLCCVQDWDRSSGKFELGGKVVSFDKWDGPYNISDKPKVETAELKR
jgi:hypothetical protein